MNIKAFERLTNIHRDTIRYYDRNSLFDRKASLFSEEYNESDAFRLKRIVILRKMGVSVDDIGRLFAIKKRTSLKGTLEKHLTALEKEKDKFLGAYQLCQAMLARTTELTEGEYEPIADELEIERWQAFIKAEEKAGHPFIECRLDREGLFVSMLPSLWVKDLRKTKFVRFVTSLTCQLAFAVCFLLFEWWEQRALGGSDWIVLLILGAYVNLSSIPACLLGKKHPRAAFLWEIGTVVILPLLMIIILLCIC